jgi:hypothetical protein
MICIVSHKSHKCKLCAEWAHHYTYSTLDGETSLSHAEAQCETIIHTALATKHAMLQQHHSTLQQTHDALWQNNNSLQQTNTSLLHELDIVCIDLMQDYDDLASD